MGVIGPFGPMVIVPDKVDSRRMRYPTGPRKRSRSVRGGALKITTTQSCLGVACLLTFVPSTGAASTASLLPVVNLARAAGKRSSPQREV